MEQAIRDLVAGETLHIGEATRKGLARLYSRLRPHSLRLRYQAQTVDGESGYVAWAVPDTDAVAGPIAAPDAATIPAWSPDQGDRAMPTARSRTTRRRTWFDYVASYADAGGSLPDNDAIQRRGGLRIRRVVGSRARRLRFEPGDSW